MPDVIDNFEPPEDVFWAHEMDEGPPEPDVRYCDHDVPGGCSECRRGWAWEATWEAVERGEIPPPFAPVEEDLAPFGPAWQDEQRDREEGR